MTAARHQVHEKTVTVVIAVPPAGVWAAGVVDLSPLGATPVG